jgi:hypothetical protein
MKRAVALERQRHALLRLRPSGRGASQCARREAHRGHALRLTKDAGEHVSLLECLERTLMLHLLHLLLLLQCHDKQRAA